MKKKFLSMLIVSAIAVTAMGCSNNTNESSKSAASSNINVSVSDSSDESASADVKAKITLSNNSISAEGDGVEVVDKTITINSGGTYEVSGTLEDGQIIVDSADEINVYIVFNGVDISCSNSAPIYVKSAKNTIITLADNSENYLSDGSEYLYEELNDDGTVTDEPSACIFSKDDLNEVKKSLRKAFVVISFLSIPITFGLIGISDKFVPILFGNEFLSVIPLTKISPVLVIIIGLGNVFGTQYLLAIGKNKEYTASVCIGALVNFCFNLLLIPRFAAMGAVIATVSAELSIALIQFWFARVVFDFTWIKETYKYWVSGILMLAIVRLVGNVTPISILFLVLQIAIGSLVYFISLIILRDKFLFEAIENVIDRIRKR